MTETKLTRWCNGIIEIGWLFALIATPLFFNIHSDRVFEPDKITLLRSLAVAMSCAWLVRAAELRLWQPSHWGGPSWWRKPLVLPVLIIVAVYLISTLFSVAPRTSLYGSYQRLQGTYTTFSYIVIFALVSTTLRTRAQLQRAITTIIVSTFPVTLYGMLQKFQLDPLPWGGDTTTRIAGHLGNAIFIGSYLIMAVPLTAQRIIDSFYHILTDKELSWADVVRSSLYILALALQLLAIYWSQSRGPLIGLGMGMFAFVLILLVALRNSAEKTGSTLAELLWPALFLLIGIATLFLAALLQPTVGDTNSFYFFGLIVVALFVAIFLLAALRRGWRWLWLAWIFVLTYMGAVLLLYNFSVQAQKQGQTPPLAFTAPLFQSWGQLPTIGRLGQLLDTEAGTSQVRLLIWQGALELIQPHDPLQKPDGTPDRWNSLRPLIGYGPEGMYVAYNRFYVPELGNIEARNASPDRSHNETFDALVITGGLGFVAWQLLYLSAFYYALRYIGVIRSNFDRNLLIAFWFAGAFIATLLTLSFGSAIYLGISIPFGSIMGLILYLFYYALIGGRNYTASADYDSDLLTMISLVAALIAFFVEIHFGIAIVSTRLYAFFFMGLIVVIAQKSWQQEKEERITPPAPSQRWSEVAIATALMAFIQIINGYDFVNFSTKAGEQITSAEQIPTAIEILRRAFLFNPRQEFISSPYLYMVMLLSWLFGSLIWAAEGHKSGVRPSLAPLKRSKSAEPTTNLPALLLGGAGLIGGFLLLLGLNQTPPTNGQRLTNLVGGLWFLATTSTALYLWLRPTPTSRLVAASTATIGLIFALPLLITAAAGWGLLAGGLCAVTLYLLRDEQVRGHLLPFGFIAFVSILIGLIYYLIHANLLRTVLFIAPSGVESLGIVERRTIEALRIGRLLSQFYTYTFLLYLLAATLLAWPAISTTKNAVKQTVSWLATAVAALVGVWLITTTNLGVVRADMIYKRGRPFDQQAAQLAQQLQVGNIPAEQQNQATQAIDEFWQTAISIYERTINIAPNEDFYYLWLGRGYLEQATWNSTNRQTLLETAETRLLAAQRINPLNTDHTANLARLNVRWAELSPVEQKQARIEQAEKHYLAAISLSPHNAVIRNEYAGLYLSLVKDCGQGRTLFRQSIAVDPYYEQSYLRLASAELECALSTEGTYDVAALPAVDEVLTEMFEGVPVRNHNGIKDSAARLYMRLAQAYLTTDSADLVREALAKARATALSDFSAEIDLIEQQLAP